MAAIITMPNSFKSTIGNLDNLRPRLKPRGSRERLDKELHQSEYARISFQQETPANINMVRRPLSGHALKPNTRATIRIVNRTSGAVQKVFNELGSTNPQNTPKIRDKVQEKMMPEDGYDSITDHDDFDAANPQNNEWTDFFLTKVGEAREEKIQLTETFGDPILYVFGEKPKFLSFRGFLMNTQDFNWRAQFWENWDKYFRASKLVENNNHMTIFFDDVYVRGYPINAVCQQTAESPNVMVFSFNFYVIDYVNRYMQDVVELHKMRLPQEVWVKGTGQLADPFGMGGLDFDQFTIRPGEYITQGAYDSGTRRQRLYVRTMDGKRVLAGSKEDPLVITGRRKKAPDGIWVDSTRVLYENVFASDVDFAKRAWESTVPSNFLGSIVSSMLSAKSKTMRSQWEASAFLANYIARTARAATNRTLMENAATTHKWSGGRRRQQMMFGAVSHMYNVLFRNLAGTIGEQSPNFAKDGRWFNALDSLLISGNINSIADYIGYAIKAGFGAFDKFASIMGKSKYGQLTGQKHSLKDGFVRDHRMSFNFSNLSAKQEGATTASGVLFGTQEITFDGADNSSTGNGPIDSLGEADDGYDQPEDSSASDGEQDAAANSQEAGADPASDGAMNEVETPDEEEEDGGEE